MTVDEYIRQMKARDAGSQIPFWGNPKLVLEAIADGLPIDRIKENISPKLQKDKHFLISATVINKEGWRLANIDNHTWNMNLYALADYNKGSKTLAEASSAIDLTIDDFYNAVVEITKGKVKGKFQKLLDADNISMENGEEKLSFTLKNKLESLVREKTNYLLVERKKQVENKIEKINGYEIKL